MINFGGIVVLVVLVFGIYILSGGSMDIVLHALPAEGGTIGGAAAATIVIGNSIGVLAKIGRDLGAVISGSKWKTADYRDLLCLMYTLTKLAKSKGRDGARAAYREPAREHDLPRVPAHPRRPFRDRPHLRHAAHGADELRQPARRRGGARPRDREAPPRVPQGREGPRLDGGRAPGARHRRRRARRREDDGLDRPAAGDPRRHDRRRP